MATDGPTPLFQVLETARFVGPEWDAFLDWVRAPRTHFPDRVRSVIDTVIRLGLREIDRAEPSDEVRGDLRHLFSATTSEPRGEADPFPAPAATETAPALVAVFEAAGFFGPEFDHFVAWAQAPREGLSERVRAFILLVLRSGLRVACGDAPSDDVRDDLDGLLQLLLNAPPEQNHVDAKQSATALQNTRTRRISLRSAKAPR